jgi:hypothetical protein
MLLLFQRCNGATEPMGWSVIVVSALLSVAALASFLEGFLRMLQQGGSAMQMKTAFGLPD